jgi:hypothetical protein
VARARTTDVSAGSSTTGERLTIATRTFFALFEAVDDFVRTVRLMEHHRGELNVLQEREVRDHLHAAKNRMSIALENVRGEYHKYLDTRRKEIVPCPKS